MSRQRRTWIAAAAAVIAGWLATMMWAGATPLPASLAWAAVCAVAFVVSRTNGARATWFNIAFALIAFGAFDAYLAARPVNGDKVQTFGDAGALFVVDDTLGVRPTAGLRTTARMRVGDVEIYDVVYTFDEHALRVSPPQPAASDQDDCVLFFGGSFTFGEGVEDDETMAYRTGILREGRVRVRNFGFSGYGPHQMLAAIDSGFVHAAAGCRPRYAVYQAVYHHVLRAAGIWSWDRHGPRFVLDENGRAVRAGNFDTDTRSLGDAVGKALGKDSGLARRVRRKGMDVGTSEATENDVKLFQAIVATAADHLRALWPGLEFHVIYWDQWDSLGPYDLFDHNLQSKGVTLHKISEILPAREDWERVYKLPHDVHPSAEAHRLMAEYVVREIVAPGP